MEESANTTENVAETPVVEGDETSEVKELDEAVTPEAVEGAVEGEESKPEMPAL